MRSRTLPALGLLILAVSTSRADVAFRRSGAAPDEVSKWFSALDGLLDDYDAALEKLTAGARSSGDTRAKNLAEAFAAVSSMADRYAIVADDTEGAAKVKASLNGKAAFEDAVSLKKGSLYR